MIINSCGEGKQIERNKKRIEIVNELAKSELIELYIDVFVNGLVENTEVKENIEFLFYENIDNTTICNDVKDAKTLSCEEIIELKSRMLKCYKEKPSRGYLMCVSTHINNIISSRV